MQHRRSKHAGRQVLRRNLLIVGAVLLTAGALAAYLNLRDREIPLLLPERHDPAFQMAQRQDRDNNAFFALVDAEAALPPIPEELRGQFDAAIEDLGKAVRDYVPQPGDYMGITKNAATSPLRDYLLQCGPAVEQMRAALQKPYYLQPQPPNRLYEQSPVYFRLLQSVALGHAAVLAATPETLREGLEELIDCMRLSRMLWKEQAEELFARGTEEHAHEILYHAVLRAESASHLEWLQDQLQRLGAPFANRQALIEQSWVALDNSLTWAPPRDGIGEAIETYKNFSDIRFRTRGWLPVRQKVIEMANAPFSMCNHIMHSDPPTKQVLEDSRYRFWYHVTIAKQAAEADLYYLRSLTLVALERCRNAQGTYPAQLEALAPQFLPALPKDNISDLPLQYTSDGAGAIAYAPGENRIDNGGAEDDLRVITIPLP